MLDQDECMTERGGHDNFGTNVLECLCSVRRDHRLVFNDKDRAPVKCGDVPLDEPGRRKARYCWRQGGLVEVNRECPELSINLHTQQNPVTDRRGRARLARWALCCGNERYHSSMANYNVSLAACWSPISAHPYRISCTERKSVEEVYLCCLWRRGAHRP